jgi:hypothetical protein
VIGARDGLLDELAQQDRFATDELVDGVDVDSGSSGDSSDRGGPVADVDHQLASSLEDALSGLG